MPQTHPNRVSALDWWQGISPSAHRVMRFPDYFPQVLQESMFKEPEHQTLDVQCFPENQQEAHNVAFQPSVTLEANRNTAASNGLGQVSLPLWHYQLAGSTAALITGATIWTQLTSNNISKPAHKCHLTVQSKGCPSSHESFTENSSVSLWLSF